MEGMTKVTKFKFPIGYGKDRTANLIKIDEDIIDAFLVGELAIKKLYRASKKNKKAYDHRIIFLNEFYEQGCIFKDKNNIILDKKHIIYADNKQMITDTKNMLASSSDPIEGKTDINALVTAIDVAKLFIEGEGAVKSSYNEMKVQKQHPDSIFPEGNPYHFWFPYWYGMIEYLLKDKSVSIYIKNNGSSTL